jgi:hypothetical protein
MKSDLEIIDFRLNLLMKMTDFINKKYVFLNTLFCKKTKFLTKVSVC